MDGGYAYGRLTTERGVSCFLAVRACADGSDALTLYDGHTAWVGRLDDAALTPPKFGVSRELFRRKLSEALLRPSDGSVKVNHAAPSSLLLVWSATLTQDEDIGGIDIQLRQAVSLVPEEREGESLASILYQLARQLNASERTLCEKSERLTRLQEEETELARLEKSLAESHRDMQDVLLGRFLVVINQKKQRVRALEKRLRLWEDGGHTSAEEDDSDPGEDKGSGLALPKGAEPDHQDKKQCLEPRMEDRRPDLPLLVEEHHRHASSASATEEDFLSMLGN